MFFILVFCKNEINTILNCTMNPFQHHLLHSLVEQRTQAFKLARAASQLFAQRSAFGLRKTKQLQLFIGAVRRMLVRGGSCSSASRAEGDEGGMEMPPSGLDLLCPHIVGRVRMYLTFGALSSFDQDSVDGNEGRDEEVVTKAPLSV